MKLKAFKKKIYEIFAQRTPEQQEAKMERLYETLTKQLHKPVVMQAEGSDGAKGATVASEGQEKHVRVECRCGSKTVVTRYGIRQCGECGRPK